MTHCKQIYLHIGLPKTGTSSIQKCLTDYRELLNASNLDYYQSIYPAQTHSELVSASIRYERDTFGKLARNHIDYTPFYSNQISAIVHKYMNDSRYGNLIFSAEGLSFLRFQDEIDVLMNILLQQRNKVKVILYLRNKRDFLNSYRIQLHKNPDRAPSKTYWSALYVEDDTWLIDYDALIELYSKNFGKENLVIFDYDEEVKNRGNVIPSFLEAIGFANQETSHSNMLDYWENRTCDNL